MISIRDLARIISDSVDESEATRAIGEKEKDTRTGKVSYIFSLACTRSNIAFFRGGYYCYNGRIYEPIETSDFENAICISMRDFNVSEADLSVRRSTILNTVKSEVRANSLKPRKGLICFTNCVLDIETGKTYKHSPENHAINDLGYIYDKSAACNLWHKFLDRVLPRTELQSVLQEYLGLIFLDRSKSKLEKIAILVGNGANGKSVVYLTITGILGRDNVSNHELRSLVGGEDKCQKNIAAIDGKLLNYCSDLDRKEIAGGSFKRLVSGEPAEARRLYKDPYTAYNIPIFMANANELPATSDHTGGFIRRLLPISFDVTIPEAEQDKELHLKLESEYSGIFNWVIEGRDRFVKNGFRFTESESVSRRVMEYERDENSSLRFIYESGYWPRPSYTGHQPEIVSAGDLYREYAVYCEKYGYGKFAENKFGKKVAEKGFTKTRKSAGNVYSIYRMPLVSDWEDISARGKTDMSLQEWTDMCEYKNGFKTVDAGAEEEKEEAKVSGELFENIVPF